MSKPNVHTISELHVAIARAVAKRDVDALCALQALTEGWLLPENEIAAIQGMLSVLAEAMDELANYEEG